MGERNDMETIKFSIHVPVYKVEPYLGNCVQSILQQTYRNFELFLVDDGSPDNCPAMCDAYAAQDRRVHAIHKPNGGPFLARRTSLSYATGDYVVFVDSDDWVAPNWLETIYQVICAQSPDMVLFDWMEAYEDRQVLIQSALVPGKRYEGESMRALYSGYLRGISNSLCTKAYRREIICTQDDLAQYGRVQTGEDAIQLTVPMQYAKSAIYVNKPLYYYRKTNSSSLMSNAKPSKIADWKKMIAAVHEFRVKMELNDPQSMTDTASGLSGVCNCMLDCAVACKLPKEEQLALCREIRDSELYALYAPYMKGKSIRQRKKMILFLLDRRWYGFTLFVFKLWEAFGRK